jgi:hypothetical protein
LVTEGDDETTLNLFLAALDGFTFMDIHRDHRIALRMPRRDRESR